MSEVPLWSGGALSTCGAWMASVLAVQGYLAQKKTPLPRTLQKAYAYGTLVVLGGGGGCNRCTPVECNEKRGGAESRFPH